MARYITECTEPHRYTIWLDAEIRAAAERIRRARGDRAIADSIRGLLEEADRRHASKATAEATP